MLQIKKYDLELINTSNLFANLDNEIETINQTIKKDLKKLKNINEFDDFFSNLNDLLSSYNDFSFITASHEVVQKLEQYNTDLIISSINLYYREFKGLDKFLKKKNVYTLNDVLEFIFGYHIESRTQTLKKIFKIINLQNCAYCLAQYTISYISKENKIYLKGNIDHISPKSKNALISVSLNNLIPVCAHCNQRKSSAKGIDFDYKPFKEVQSGKVATFNYNNVLSFKNGEVIIDDITKLKIDNINETLESRLEITNLYHEYHSTLANLLIRYNYFNSAAYKNYINQFNKDGMDIGLEFFISEVPFTEENLQNIPLQKFKMDFYYELEYYKNITSKKYQF